MMLNFFATCCQRLRRRYLHRVAVRAVVMVSITISAPIVLAQSDDAEKAIAAIQATQTIHANNVENDDNGEQAVDIADAGKSVPGNIVSMNLCTDQFLISLADPAQIQALTFLSHDPEESAFYTQARAFPTVIGNTESILLTAPDVVLADVWSDPFTIAQLGEVGVPVGQAEQITDMASLASVYRQMGEWIGHPERAEAQLAAFSQTVSELSAEAAARGYLAQPLRYLEYSTGGYVSGSGSLNTALLSQFGMVNIADEIGMTYGGYISYEQLLLQQPDVLFIPIYRPDSASIKAAMAHHPVMQTVAEQSLVIRQPSSQWRCFSPAMGDLLRQTFAQISAYRDSRQATNL